MIGTSISMQSSGEMVNPSITICDGGSPVYKKGIQSFHLIENIHAYNLSNATTNHTFSLIPDLSDMFVQLHLKMSNRTDFTLKPHDLKDRETGTHFPISK